MKLLLEVLCHIDGSRICPWTNDEEVLPGYVALNASASRSSASEITSGPSESLTSRLLKRHTYIYTRCSFRFHQKLSIRIYPRIVERSPFTFGLNER